jgi:DNA-3-methyladenine glycosylase II
MKTVGELRVAQPFPWAQMLAYLAPRLIPGAEQVTADAYERRIGDTILRVELGSSPARLRVQTDGRVAVEDVLQRVARLFDVEDGWTEARQALRDDPAIGPRLARMPGMRPLGAWCPFELCARTVLGQQVTVAGAGTLMRRLVDRCATLTPAGVLAADLSAMGMPGKRVDTIRALATAFAGNPRLLEAAAWPETESALRTVAGIGPWTLAYLAIRLGRQADAFPHSDIGLIRAAGAASPAALLKLSERWRPHRALAATYLWSVP